MTRPDWSQRAFPVLDILEVHDGDTYRLELDTGFEHSAWPWLRLKDFSCPELTTEPGKLAQHAAATLLHAHLKTLWVVTFRTPTPYVVKRHQDDHMTFGRYLAQVWLDVDLLLGDELVRNGFARPGAFQG